MRTLWIRYWYVTLLLLAAGAGAVRAETGDVEPVWHKRHETMPPLSWEEKLALEMVARHQQQMKEGQYVILYDGDRGDFAQITVRRLGGSEDVDTIRRYLVKNGRIVAFCDPEYEQPPRPHDPRRKANALRVARQTHAGEAPIRPDIYDGFMYTVAINGCIAVVTERNTEREAIETYEFNLCE